MSWEMNKTSVGLLLLLMGVLVVFPMFVSDYIATMLIIALHYAYLAQSWNLVFGYCGQLALGHSVFYGVGGYVSTKLLVHL